MQKLQINIEQAIAIRSLAYQVIVPNFVIQSAIQSKSPFEFRQKSSNNGRNTQIHRVQEIA
tara:strand:+ start:142 stop:324 length:183 start_codon:yes stop_codon:yes gene_type:complete